jgi:hypothetical protein
VGALWGQIFGRRDRGIGLDFGFQQQWVFWVPLLPVSDWDKGFA